MAESNSDENSLGSPVVQHKLCESHGLIIDIICEGCDEFICGMCAKTDHRNHKWKTLTTAATERRRDLLEFLTKIKKEDTPEIDKKIKNIPQQMTNNKKMCDSEIEKLEWHCGEIMARLTEIKKRHEQALRDKLVEKNDQLNSEKSELEITKKRIIDIVEFLEDNNSTMSDYGLIDNQRELTKMFSELEFQMTNCKHSLKFSRGEINEDLLESLLGSTFDSNNIGMSQINSFKYGDSAILFLEALSEDQCYIEDYESEYTEVNKQGVKGRKISITSHASRGICLTDNGDIYFSDSRTNSICCLSPSGSVYTVISTDPLVPGGICQSMYGGLLVTLRDEESGEYFLNSHSRRLVKHVTVTGHVIYDYEFLWDGETRLFTLPLRVTQNSNSDICVVNNTSDYSGELVIISSSGHMKSVYLAQEMAEVFSPVDVVCDPLCNILVTDYYSKRIHLLSPDGEFLKFLMTGDYLNGPFSLSMYKSTLWVGYLEGLVKVYQYTM